ncbi:MAG: 16S rRNA (guanine(966)-N(2))-methyltransferase RsmD [Gammaproteobacteria bacterium]
MKSGVRIIGGKWRGRKLAVIDTAGLRPTPDRIRETLFNWLAADCRGADVLDCFAGSGVLGFEALSRGARSLVALERSPAALDNLRGLAASLDSGAVEIRGGEAIAAIADLRGEYDLVFIDPPYAEAGLRARAFERLESGGRLRPGARIYFEWPAGEEFELPSENLAWLKRKTAGQVNYAIAEWRPSG